MEFKKKMGATERREGEVETGKSGTRMLMLAYGRRQEGGGGRGGGRWSV